MRLPGVALVLGGLVAASCALPEVVYDPAAGTGGTTGTGGTGGTTGDAGASGDDRESVCLEYCGIYFGACEDFEANTYASEVDCNDKCIVPEAQGGWPFGPPSAPNTVECRFVHAKLARDNPTMLDPHCFHSAEVPTKGACN